MNGLVLELVLTLGTRCLALQELAFTKNTNLNARGDYSISCWALHNL